MTLQENAFMKNLIMQNYRRRMMFFILNLLVFPIIAFICIYFEEELTINTGLIMSIIGIAAFSRFFVRYILRPDGDNFFPWSIKKRQIKTMEQMVKGNANFEELKDYVQLNEYFI